MPLHYVSTCSVLYSTTDTPGLLTEDRHVDVDQVPVNGYIQSKWVAEELVREAGRRGLPVAVYRPGRISGASDSGAANPGDFFSTWLRGAIELGALPNPDDTLDMAPVDYVARGIVHLSLTRAPGGAFHFFNRRTLPVGRLAERLRARGYAVRDLPYREWLAELRAAVAAGEANALAPWLPVYVDDPDTSEPELDCTATEELLAAAGILCPPADAALADLYLAFLERRGALPAPQPQELVGELAAEVAR